MRGWMAGAGTGRTKYTCLCIGSNASCFLPRELTGTQETLAGGIVENGHGDIIPAALRHGTRAQARTHPGGHAVEGGRGEGGCSVGISSGLSVTQRAELSERTSVPLCAD
jgi:hypothetical protein